MLPGLVGEDLPLRLDLYVPHWDRIYGTLRTDLLLIHILRIMFGWVRRRYDEPQYVYISHISSTILSDFPGCLEDGIFFFFFFDVPFGNFKPISILLPDLLDLLEAAA